MSSNQLSTVTTKDKPHVSLNRQTVLEEDEYTAAISSIIARDFFPSLAHLDATNSYLSALDSQDPELIGKSVQRLADLGGPTPLRRTPWGQSTPSALTPSQTPLRTPTPRGHIAKKPKYDTSLSLDAFQAKYTSEDNASFTEILDEENRERRAKWWWAWEAERKATELKGKELEGRQKLLLEAVDKSSQQARIEGSHTLAIESGQATSSTSSQSESALVVRTDASTSKEDEEEIDVMAPRKDTRPAGVPGWRFKNRNSLMFPPDADISPYHPLSTIISTEAAPRNVPKEVKHANTRLSEQSEHTPDQSVPPSPSRSRIGAAIAGTKYRPAEEDTPKVGGFGFVSAVPSPSPSQLGPEAMKELMTWGTLLGTPRLVSSSGDEHAGRTPFTISQPSSRDTLGRKLGSQASKSLRDKAALLSRSTPKRKRGDDGDMLPPSFTPRRSAADMLSPAGRSLLGRTRGAGAGLLSTPRSVQGGGTTPQRPKELDLGKVGWSPRESPVPHRRRG